MTQPERAG